MDYMADNLGDLWESTEALYRRFGITHPDFDAAFRVFGEEVFEFINEITLPMEITDAAELMEAADVLVTIIGLLIARGFNFQDFASAIDGVRAKNDLKTGDSHYVSESGKITRKLSDSPGSD